MTILVNEILEEVKDWVPNPIYSHTWDMKYFKLAKTYRIVKAMVGHTLEKQREENRDTLHVIRIFGGNFELCKS
jgi:hypothetical protein